MALPWVRRRLETRLHVAVSLAEALDGEMDAELPPTPQDGSGCLREDAGKDASQEELGDRAPCSQCCYFPVLAGCALEWCLEAEI